MQFQFGGDGLDALTQQRQFFLQRVLDRRDQSGAAGHLLQALLDAELRLLVQRRESAAQRHVHQCAVDDQRVVAGVEAHRQFEIAAVFVRVARCRELHLQLAIVAVLTHQQASEADDGGKRGLGEPACRFTGRRAVVFARRAQDQPCVLAVLGELDIDHWIDQFAHPLKNLHRFAQRRTGGEKSLEVGQIFKGEGLAEHERKMMRAGFRDADAHGLDQQQPRHRGVFQMHQVGRDAEFLEDRLDVEAAARRCLDPVGQGDERDRFLVQRRLHKLSLSTDNHHPLAGFQKRFIGCHQGQ